MAVKYPDEVKLKLAKALALGVPKINGEIEYIELRCNKP
jgi:hypothetical protein